MVFILPTPYLFLGIVPVIFMVIAWVTLISCALDLRRNNQIYKFRTSLLFDRNTNFETQNYLYNKLPSYDNMMKSSKPIEDKYWFTKRDIRMKKQKPLDISKKTLYDGSGVSTYWSRIKLMYLPPVGYECKISSSGKVITVVENWYRGTFRDGDLIDFPTNELAQEEFGGK